MFQASIDFSTNDVVTVNTPKTLEKSLFKDGAFDSMVGKNQRTCRRLAKVRVYRNLNKPEFYSIMAMDGINKGKVIGYARSMLLENCQLVVSEASQGMAVKTSTHTVKATSAMHLTLLSP